MDLVVAQAAHGNGRHPTKLAATKDADGAAGQCMGRFMAQCRLCLGLRITVGIKLLGELDIAEREHHGSPKGHVDHASSANGKSVDQNLAATMRKGMVGW